MFSRGEEATRHGRWSLPCVWPPLLVPPCRHHSLTAFWLGLGNASESSTACQEDTASPVQLAQETAPTHPHRVGVLRWSSAQMVEETDAGQRGEKAERGGRREAPVGQRLEVGCG